MIPPLPNGPFSVLYFDPPWTFKVRSDKGKDRSAENHYSVMALADIKAMGAEIERVAAKDSVLFLWVTDPLLPEGLEVMRAWGFTYKTIGFYWTKRTKHGKPHIGTGYYTRANPEMCLLGTRGKGLPRQSRGVRRWIESTIGRHSAKPAEVRDRIEALFGDVPRLEGFAREVSPGWVGWGLEYPQ